MRSVWFAAVGVAVISGATTAYAGVTLVITTDSELNNNGGIDEFIALPADGVPRTVYIWGSATPNSQTIFEFNFDLNGSGSGLSFSNAAICSFFTGVSGSLADTNLNDLQLGWSAFFGTPPTLPVALSYTLFATVDVAIAPGSTPGPETTLSLDGNDFRIIDANLNEIATTGTSRNLAVGCQVHADCDDGHYCNGFELCVTGSCTFGGPPCVAVEVCDESIDFCIQSPTVAGVGPRYLRIDVNSSDANVGHAIRIRDVAAGLDKYVDIAGVSDSCLPGGQHGMLVDNPVCRSESGWGVIYVSDAFICPDTEYEVTIATGVSCTTGLLTHSNATTGTTYRWGDLDNDSQNRIVDVLYAIDGFLCRTNAPTYVSDIGTDGAPGLPNAPDRLTTMHDIINVMDAFLGESYPYSCEPTILAQVESASRVEGTLIVQPRQDRIHAGDTVVVDVFVSDVSAVRGYELSLNVTGRAIGLLTVESAEVDESHVSFAFRDMDHESVSDLVRVRLGSALYSGSVSVANELAYLGSFTLRASENARGKFTVTVWADGPAMLLDAVGAEIVPAEIEAGIIHVLKKPKRPTGGR